MEDSTATKAHPLEGQLLEGKYQVLEKLGHGGMGIVYRAKHTLMDREVALKVLHSHLVESEEFLKRFKHEAQVASKLRHPNAVMIYDFGIAEKQPYLVMEFVQGDTLKDLLSKEGAMPPRKVLEIMGQVFSALEEAHRLGIVHRDLKPDNFILTPKEDGSTLARVLDFGIAKVLRSNDGKEATLMTQAGAFFGTPRYASPEQALGKELDSRADIYALGVILYEALTGEVPFDAPSMMELLMKHLNQPPPAIRTTHPELGISEEIEKVVLRALEKEKEKRFQSVSEFHHAFREAVEKGVAQIRTGSNAPLFVMGGAVLALLGTAGYLFFGSSSPESAEVAPVPTAEPTSIAAIDLVPANKETPAAVPSEVPSPPVVIDATQTSAPLITVTIAVEATETPVQETTPAPLPSETPPPPTATPVPEATPSPVVTPAMTPTPDNDAADAAKLDPVAAFRKGEQLYRAKNYSKAVTYYKAVVTQDPAFKKARLSLGICFLRLRRMDEAFEQFKAAFELDRTYPPTLFNFACYYALTGEKDAALKWLEKTIQYEPSARRWARTDQDLANLRGEPRFRELVGE